MLDVSYPLFGGAAVLTIVCAGCIWGRLSQLGRRLAAVEQRPLLSVVPAAAPPPPQLSMDPQHTEVYIPPIQRPSAPPAVIPFYYDGTPRVAVI